MQVDVLVVPDCPNGPVVIERLAQALGGRTDVQVATRVIDTIEQADHWGMHGSPTVLIDGRDPFAAPGTRPASRAGSTRTRAAARRALPRSRGCARP